MPVLRRTLRSKLQICAFLLATLSKALPLQAQHDSPIVPHRYLVVYRNAEIPGDAEIRTISAGAKLIQRNDHFGSQ